MINIGKPFLTEDDKYVFLKANIQVTESAVKNWLKYAKEEPEMYWKLNAYPPLAPYHSKQKAWSNYSFEVYFRVEKKYKDSLCIDRADAFVAALIFYAMVCGEDITSEMQISEEILYKLNHQLIPLLCNSRSGYKRIKVYASSATETYNNCNNGVATGMSCGVDSFASLQKHHFGDVPSKYKLTHLTYFDAGNVYRLFDENEKDEETLYDKLEEVAAIKCQNAQKIAEATELKFISVYSNLDRILYRGAYMHSAIYRNCACALALQKVIGLYINSTAGFPVFKPSLKYGSGEYEVAILNSFSTKNIEFLLGCVELSRFDRTIMIADNPLVQKNLDVCWNFSACGVCGKCYRTQISLDIIGKLDLFKDVFDVEKYKKNRKIAFAWLLHYKSSLPSHMEILEEIKQRNIKIPTISYLISFAYSILDMVKPIKKRMVNIIKHK